MADKDSMSVEEILAACRRLDGSKSGEAPVAKSAEAPPAPAEAAAPAPAKPAAAAPAGKSAKEMSVADILAAARGEKTGGAAQPSAPKKEAAAGEAAPSPKPAAPAKKPGEMSVADILAAARGQKPTTAAAVTAPAAEAPAAPKPAPAAKPKPAAAPAAKEAAKKPAAASAAALDTQSILAAARKGDKRGPMTKEEAKAKTAVAEKPAAKSAKTKLQPPPMPEKPAYAVRPERIVTPAAQTRRSFFGSAVGVFLGSSLAVGFTMLTLTNLLWLLGLARFMFPNILTEPPMKFKAGFPGDYAPGQVETKFIPQFGVWIVNYMYEGQPMIYALKSVCTHLGCTPNWLDAEQKFKCPCHGSGFYKDGINFEGPAPRPLERYAIRVADDGQLEIDKSQTFNEELGAWANPASYVPV
jgi:cytochrome b6-f complex iron-sulfur subunit